MSPSWSMEEMPKQLEIVGRKEKHVARLMNDRFVEDTWRW